MSPIDHRGFSLDQLPKWFWETIAKAHGEDGPMTTLLRDMDKAQLREFHALFKFAATQLQDEPFTSQLGDISEDTLEDIAESVVARGQDFYEMIWRDPALISHHLPVLKTSHFAGLAAKIYWDRFREPIESPLKR